MNVVYIGNFEPDHSTENHYARSLEDLGHRVLRLQEPRSANRHARFLRRVALECSHVEPGLVLYTRTWGLPMAETTALWRSLHVQGWQTAAVHLDRWLGLDREHEIREQPMFTMAHVFTADGDADAMYAEAGVNHHWLRPGVLSAECFDAAPGPAYEQYAVGFVGSAPTSRGGNYHDEWPHRRELVEFLRETYGSRFVHVGNGGDLPVLRGDPLNRLYATVPVIVGDSCFTSPEARYWSDRVYETWGRGGLLVHPYCEALEDEIGPYPCWDVGDWQTLREVVNALLAQDGLRSMLKEEIGGYVRKHATYTQRAAELIEVVSR